MLASAFALFVALLAAFTDARSGRIPNWLTLGGVSAGCSLGALGAGFPGLGAALLGVGIGASPWLIGYLVGRGQGVGGGDVKLFGAFGALLGAERALQLALAALLSLLATWALRRGLALRDHEPSAPPRRPLELRLGPPVLVALILLTWLGPVQ